MRSFDSVEGLFKTLLDQPLSDLLDRSCPTRERLGNSLVGPVRPVGVSLQQNLGTPNLLAGSLQLLDDDLQFRPLLVRQSHHVHFLHGTPPGAMQNRRFDRICQPELLGVTEH